MYALRGLKEDMAQEIHQKVKMVCYLLCLYRDSILCVIGPKA
jgi:hypothetical protein